MKIYCHDFQFLDGMSTIPSTFVSPPTIHHPKKLIEAPPYPAAPVFSPRCKLTVLKIPVNICEVFMWNVWKEDVFFSRKINSYLSIKCPHLLKLPGQVQVQVVVGAAVQVAAEWILTQKLQRQTEKTTMDGRNFASRGWYFISHLRYVSTLSGGDLSGWTMNIIENTLGMLRANHSTWKVEQEKLLRL